MSNRNPFDELESLLEERQQKRPSYLKVLLDSVPYIRDKASEWFEEEVRLAQKEIKLLEQVMPESTKEWEMELHRIRTKFGKAGESLDKIAEKVKKGKVISISEIYRGKPEERYFPPPTLIREKQEEEALDLASSFLDILDAAKNLEDLIQRVEREAIRTLTLRRLVKIELGTK